MSKQLSDQANKVWGLLSDPNTTSTYTQTLDVTWKIIRETGSLLWLTLCLSLVGVDWFWSQSIGAGRRFRNWLETMEKPSSDKVTAEAGKAIASVGKNGVSYAVSAARKQLGLPEKEISAPVKTTMAIAPTSISTTPIVEPIVEPAPTPIVEPASEAEATEFTTPIELTSTELTSTSKSTQIS